MIMEAFLEKLVETTLHHIHHWRDLEDKDISSRERQWDFGHGSQGSLAKMLGRFRRVFGCQEKYPRRSIGMNKVHKESCGTIELNSEHFIPMNASPENLISWELHENMEEKIDWCNGPACLRILLPWADILFIPGQIWAKSVWVCLVTFQSSTSKWAVVHCLMSLVCSVKAERAWPNLEHY